MPKVAGDIRVHPSCVLFNIDQQCWVMAKRVLLVLHVRRGAGKRGRR